MGEKTIPALFVTANVGSIFEDPSVMLKIWTEEFLSTVTQLDPKFVALHCQEVGGKNYEHSMKHVEYFVRLLVTSEELRLFDKVRVFLDEDFSSAENFTALGNFYFIHESIQDVLMWDFKEFSFVTVGGKDIHSGNIEAVPTKEKSKFPQDFFPECKWSRKGFLRTRWNLNGTIFDLVNIHLFHDASNFVAMETFPSVYSKTRQRALEYTLHRFHNDEFGSAPFFLFGDFNFRTDTQGVIKKLSDGLIPVHVQSPKNNDHTKLLYRDESSQIILTLGKKEFSHHDHQNVFIENAGEWLKEFDHEMECFEGQLFEYPISFPPSYPYQEDAESGHAYMTTRCPAWCDRVVLSATAKQLVDNRNNVEYGSIGESTCMGDHKPVYLRIDLLGEAGRVVCCGVDRSVLHETPTPLKMDFFPIEEPPCVVDKYVERRDSSSNIGLPFLVSYEQNLSSVDLLNNHSAPAVVDNGSDISIQIDSSVNFDVSSLSDSVIIVPELPEKEKEVPNLRNSKLHSDGNIGVEFDKQRLRSLKDRKSEHVEEIEESKQFFLDRYVVKRVQSASFAEVRRVGAVRQGACRCLSESQSWRARSVSISSRMTNWRSSSKVKLISDPNLQSSLLRLQSHHSSSEEDWFEEVNNDVIVNNLETKCWTQSPVLDGLELKIKIPIVKNSVFEPTESLEDISIGKIVFEDQSKKNFKCYHMKRKYKHRRFKSKTDIKTENKENIESLTFEARNCCIIS